MHPKGFNTGLIWLDDRSQLYNKIRTRVKMGALNRMLNAKPGLVYTKFINLTEEEKEIFMMLRHIFQDLIFPDDQVNKGVSKALSC